MGLRSELAVGFGLQRLSRRFVKELGTVSQPVRIAKDGRVQWTSLNCSSSIPTVSLAIFLDRCFRRLAIFENGRVAAKIIDVRSVRLPSSHSSRLPLADS